MNPTLEELKSQALLLTPHEEMEMYAPYPKYMALFEAAIKEDYEPSPVSGGFMIKLNEVPVIIKPTGKEWASLMEGQADQLGVSSELM